MRSQPVRIRSFNLTETHPELGLSLELSQAVVASGIVFLRGQVGQSPVDFRTLEGADVGRQAEQALENAIELLREAGSGPEGVVKINVYLLDPEDRPAVYEAIARKLPSAAPATTCLVVSGFTREEFRVEFDIIGAVLEG